MDDVVAIVRHARELIGVSLGQDIRPFVMRGGFEVRPCARMTVQALAVVIRLIELDIFGFGDRAEIVDVKVANTVQLGPNPADWLPSFTTSFRRA